ncbi:MAG TPA: hybrid sensor histidine kinase/response regulator [Cyanobacteria bacterium UBA8803]|nr:hybrid sensor histidine kinase/response regulator [Cyanobacteria bacterium UBA9273]HBL57086.1 hybrid sensor histidine kinase/response regulator [Cyanobacteria bacterium UBA8803]
MTQLKKILIVEDELIPAYDLSDNLENLGYSVTGIVDTGEAALAQVSKSPPDLILMDIKLRGQINGIEAAAKIRDYDIPVIYLTAFSDNVTLKQATLTTPYGYLTKPAKLEDIRTTIAIALSKHEEDAKFKAILNEEKKLNELKSHFLATVAHDLRTPLTSILISLDLLQRYDEKLTEAKKSKHFELIQTTIRSMAEQLEELLWVNQVELGKLSCHLETLDAIAFCQELLESFQTTADRNCELCFNSQGDCTKINLDKALLRHILNNLLSNAIKYSPDGGTISLNLICEPHQVTFRTQDQGIGMPPEYLAKLFQPFERATNVGNIKGTGIGLYIVKQAVEQLKGNISVESQVGVGTTFTVTLGNC